MFLRVLEKEGSMEIISILILLFPEKKKGGAKKKVLLLSHL